MLFFQADGRAQASARQDGEWDGPQQSHIVDILGQDKKMKYYHINLTDHAGRTLWSEGISGKNANAIMHGV